MSIALQKEAEAIARKTAAHPCFNCGASGNARIHLPIAPRCNIQCNYCVRKFDCVNESRPGVVSAVLSPAQAVERFIAVKKAMPNLTVVGIAGPGDPLANFEQVKDALQRIRELDPNVTFCLSTNGLMLPFYMNHLISLGVTHVTVTVNTVNSETGAMIYDHVTYLGKRHTGKEAASLLLQNQLFGIRYLAAMGVVVKVNIVLLKGINEQEINEIVFTVKDAGCRITNIMQLIPVKGSAFESIEAMSNAELNRIRNSCEVMLPQMYHCKQCRADAVGTLSHDVCLNFAQCPSKAAPHEPVPAEQSYRFAVCSKDGQLIDQHFGYCDRFLIYDYRQGRSVLVEERETPPYCADPRTEEDGKKLEAVIGRLCDCQAILCMRAGLYPSAAFEKKGIRVLTMYNRIGQGIEEAAKLLGAGQIDTIA